MGSAVGVGLAVSAGDVGFDVWLGWDLGAGVDVVSGKLVLAGGVLAADRAVGDGVGTSLGVNAATAGIGGSPVGEIDIKQFEFASVAGLLSVDLSASGLKDVDLGEPEPSFALTGPRLKTTDIMGPDIQDLDLGL